MKDEEILSQFLEESLEHVNNFESSLLDFEKNYRSLALLQSMFRNMHTIKGSAGFLSFHNLEKVVHKAEDLFSHLQKLDDDNREATISKNNLINLFFQVNDNIKKILGTIKEKRNDTDVTTEPLIDDLNRAKDSISISTTEKKPEKKKSKRKLSPMQLKALENLKKKNAEEPTTTKDQADTGIELDDNIIIKNQSLETLSTLSSELILARNKLGSLLNDDSEQNNQLLSSFHKIDQLTHRINDLVVRIRMQPISKITDKLKRVVRDLAQGCGKEINFEVENDKIELDRTILNSLKDPLIHLIRNSIDHGIEDPETREAANKSRSGEITIKASYNEKNIILSIKDDGKGIDIEKIKNKAISNKLINEEDLNTMEQKDVLALIFEAGFSTKDEVSNISGRGVGMDVVKESIHKVNGSIEIKTEANKGTEFLIKLPLTLAQGSAIIVEINSIQYAIPSNYVKELNSIEAKDIIGLNIMEIREENYKVINACKILSKSKEKNYKDEELIEYLLIETEELSYILIVDAILDLQDIVIKPLPTHTRSLDLYSGATILPEGQVSLILDLDSLYSESFKRKINIKQNKEVKVKSQDESNAVSGKVLCFNLGKYNLGIEKSLIKEVLANKPITPIANNEIESLINLRDTVILNRKLQKLLDIKSKNPFLVNLIIDNNEEIYSLQIDDINEVVEIDDDSIALYEIDEALKNYTKAAYLIDEKPLYILEESAL